ncbi:MAG: YfdQ family protein [Minwuiales bacterium]|nr:YfdQ family protein [Minwuiales bacterium]
MTDETKPAADTPSNTDDQDKRSVVFNTWPKSPGSIDGQLLGQVKDLAEHYHTPRMIGLADKDDELDALVAVLPSGLTLHPMQPYLDAQRDKPRRRKGDVVVSRVRSFIDHANRFKDDDSALFAHASLVSPRLTAVLNYHRQSAGGTPRFGDHRTVYNCPLSDEWKAWLKQNKQPMEQNEFAEFLEDRIGDIALPPMERPKEADHADAAIFAIADQLRGNFADPARLMDMARSFKVFANEKVEQSTNLNTGEVELIYSTEHTDGTGNKLIVPNLFLIAVPVFKLGAHFRMVVRLRYRTRGGAVKFSYDIYQPDRTFEAAFEAVCSEAQAGTGLPLFYGEPEEVDEIPF